MDKKIRIVIADDVKDVLERLEKILSQVDNVELVGKAKDGKELMEKILELKPDLIVTDNQMPELNGIDVIEKIKNEYAGQCKIDSIIITGDRDLIARAVNLGVFSIINKPYEDSKVIEVIEDYISSITYAEEKKNNIIEKKSFLTILLDKMRVK